MSADGAGSYTMRIDRRNPACLVFLVDQSASMAEIIAGSEVSKAMAVTEQLNKLLYEIIQRCSRTLGELPRPYFAISVIGYGTDPQGVPEVGSRLPGTPTENHLSWTSDLAVNTLRVEQRESAAPQGSSTYKIPVWLEPVASGGTPMCAAFHLAGRIVRGWVDTYPDAFPPIVLNLTDGQATDGDPWTLADHLRNLATTDGRALLFNAVFSAHTSTPTLFPAEPDGIGDVFGVHLWSASSTLPPFMVEAARRRGIAVRPEARGFAFNADLQSLVTFLNIGTDTSHLLR